MPTLDDVMLALKQHSEKAKNMVTKEELKALVLEYAADEELKEKFVTPEQLAKQTTALEGSINNMTKQLKALAPMRYATDGNYKGSFSSRQKAKDFGMVALAAMFGLSSAKSYCEDIGIELKKATMTGDGTNEGGGILVPDTFIPEIIEMIGVYGKFRANAMVYPLGPGSNIMPKQTSDPVVYCPGEGVTITESDMDFTGLALRRQGWKALVSFSRELGDEAAIPLAELIVRSFARAFAKKEDECGFVGDGTSTYFNNTGIVNKLLAVDATPANIAGLAIQDTAGAWSAIDTDDFLEVIGLLPEDYDNDMTKFYCSKAFYIRVMLASALTSANPSLRNEMLATGYTRNPSYMGYPVEYVSAMPKVKAAADHIPVIFGDLSQASILGDRGQITVAESKEVGFKEDTIYMRANEDVAINNHGVGDTSEAGPIVGLLADIA